MAIDLTGKRSPAFITDATVGTTCTEVRVPPGWKISILGSAALYLFNEVADGGAVPASDRIALSASEAAQGWNAIADGPVASASGVVYATLCVAAQAGTVTVRVSAEAPEGGH